MAVRRSWVPDRRDMIWVGGPGAGKARELHPLLVLSSREFNARTGIVIGLPMSTAPGNDTNPFAIRCTGPRGAVSYILGHQPGSFDWKARAARPHAWKKAPEDAFVLACDTLNQIIAIG